MWNINHQTHLFLHPENVTTCLFKQYIAYSNKNRWTFVKQKRTQNISCTNMLHENVHLIKFKATLNWTQKSNQNLRNTNSTILSQNSLKPKSNQNFETSQCTRRKYIMSGNKFQIPVDKGGNQTGRLNTTSNLFYTVDSYVVDSILEIVCSRIIIPFRTLIIS